jgi:hypothetical protein
LEGCHTQQPFLQHSNLIKLKQTHHYVTIKKVVLAVSIMPLPETLQDCHMMKIVACDVAEVEVDPTSETLTRQTSTNIIATKQNDVKPRKHKSQQK